MVAIVAVIAAANGHKPAGTVSPLLRTTAPAVTAVAHQPPRATPAPRDPILIDGKPPSRLLTDAQARSASDRVVTVRRALVSSVPADEGFWIEAGGGHRVWVQLRTGGTESQIQVRPGDDVSFTGTVRAHGPDFAAFVGVTGTADAAALAATAVHVETAPSSLHLSGR